MSLNFQYDSRFPSKKERFESVKTVFNVPNLSDRETFSKIKNEMTKQEDFRIRDMSFDKAKSEITFTHAKFSKGEYDTFLTEVDTYLQRKSLNSNSVVERADSFLPETDIEDTRPIRNKKKK